MPGQEKETVPRVIQIPYIHPSPFAEASLHFLIALVLSGEKPPCGAEPRIELGPAFQQADAQPTEPRRTILSHAAPYLSHAAPLISARAAGSSRNCTLFTVYCTPTPPLPLIYHQPRETQLKRGVRLSLGKTSVNCIYLY